MAGEPEPATSYRISRPSGEMAAGLMAVGGRPSGPDVLVQPEHVVRVPGPLERDQPVVLGVAVDAANDHLVAGLGHVVHIATGDAPRLGQVDARAPPRAVRVVETGVVPHRLRADPERRRPAREGGRVLGYPADGAPERPDREHVFAVGRAR